MSNQEASTEAKAFVNAWFSRFCCPVNLQSDQGINFMSLVNMKYRSSVHSVTSIVFFTAFLYDHAPCQLIACIENYKLKSFFW